MKNLISMRDLTKEEILHLLDVAGKIENGEIVPDMQRKLAALLFFEPSTRTMFSFDTAMKRMNGDTIIMSGTQNTSAKKGESFADTLQTIAQYSEKMKDYSLVVGWIKRSESTILLIGLLAQNAARVTSGFHLAEDSTKTPRQKSLTHPRETHFKVRSPFPAVH